MNPEAGILGMLNWIDVLFIILLIRILYVSFLGGFFAECFKFFGAILAIYLSLHYYTALSDFIVSKVGFFKSWPLEFMDLIALLLLAVFSFFIGWLLSYAFTKVAKIEAIPALQRWGGFVMGCLRAVLLCGFITYACSASSVKYLHDKADASYFGGWLIHVAPRTYSAIWNGFTSHFMTSEQFNKTVTEVEKSF